MKKLIRDQNFEKMKQYRKQCKTLAYVVRVLLAKIYKLEKEKDGQMVVKKERKKTHSWRLGEKTGRYI